MAFLRAYEDARGTQVVQDLLVVQIGGYYQDASEAAAATTSRASELSRRGANATETPDKP